MNLSFSHFNLNRLGCHGILVAVVARPKSSKREFDKKGGKLVQSVDSRISLLIPKLAFDKKTKVSMQVITCSDSHFNKPIKVSGGGGSGGSSGGSSKSSGKVMCDSPKKTPKEIDKDKHNYSHYDSNFKRFYATTHPEFMGVSPIVRIKAAGTVAKNLVVKVIQPTGVVKRRKNEKMSNKSHNRTGANLFFADPDVYKESNNHTSDDIFFNNKENTNDKSNSNDINNKVKNKEDDKKRDGSDKKTTNNAHSKQKDDEENVNNNDNNDTNNKNKKTNKKKKNFLILPPIVDPDHDNERGFQCL